MGEFGAIVVRTNLVSLFTAVCLSASGADAQSATVDSRPDGALSGKIVYLAGGHGWTARNLSDGSWYTQRGETFEIIEDLLNGDFNAFQAESLWNAGATIVPLRPIGRQIREAVVDNDDPGATFQGGWNNSGSPVYFGSPGDVPYRFAATSPVETAVAVYRPDLPEAGTYPVYTWVLADFNRVDQLYRVHHTGGTTEVRVDHRMVGSGLVYLGSYHFERGTGGAVEISNRSDTPGVVIADMIRFGNGMGDIDRGGGPSGAPRQDEASLYWIETHAGQGVPTSAWRTSSDDGSSNVSTPPKWAARMNRQQHGSPSDRVFLSHHSNAANGSARGVIALYNGNNTPSSATPNQFLLADTLARRINTDMVAQDAPFEHDWFPRSVLTLDRTDFEFGEINNAFINNEFDATIVERGFHDNRLDAELLRDTRVNRALAGATTRGLIEFFHEIDGGATQLVSAPAPVTHAWAIGLDADSIELGWRPGALNAWVPDGATSYLIESSPDGAGFAVLTEVGGGDTQRTTLEGFAPGLHHFRIRARSEGGVSDPSQVLSVRLGGDRRVLIVDGFDREDRFQNVREPAGGGFIDRVRPANQNARNYAPLIARSIAASGRGVATASNEAAAAGDVDLARFGTVVWLLGEESSGTRTFDGIEQLVATNHVERGGALLVSGAEVAWDLGFLNGGELFLNETLGSGFLADDAGAYAVIGEPGTPFDGLSASFDDGTLFYDAEFPDTLMPIGDATVAMRYATGDPAAIAVPGSARRGATLTLGFPIETVTTPAARDALVAASLETLDATACPADLDGSGVLDLTDINLFVGAFLAEDAIADLNGDGVFDLTDIGAFVSAFTAGCP